MAFRKRNSAPDVDNGEKDTTHVEVFDSADPSNVIARYPDTMGDKPGEIDARFTDRDGWAEYIHERHRKLREQG